MLTTSSYFKCIGPKTQGVKAPARTGSFGVLGTIFPAPSVSDLLVDESGVSNLVHQLNKYGVVVLAPQTVPRPDDLLKFNMLFGGIVRHQRSRPNGLVLIDPSDPNSVNVAATEKEHLLHTDEAYSDDASSVVVLMCEVPSLSGGESVILSGQRVIDRLVKVAPEEAFKGLFERDALCVGRTLPGMGSNAHCESTHPILQQHEQPGRIRLRFRSKDSYIQRVNPSAAVGYDMLCTLTNDPENRLVLPLKAGHILILDNSAMAHGRLPYPQGMPRRLWRVNFDCKGVLPRGLSLGIHNSL